ncbi:CBS domain-containing protein [Magnetovibrio sp. PR-2]|uniref:CBS domain-containing protein n=1 Tax=Magnetovibrio sp. PR-2 TaxID=3120356 RepID=UPI002FCE6668
MIFKNVEQLLAVRKPISVALNDTVQDIAEKMALTDERAVAVVEDQKVVGILSEKDIVQKCVATGGDAAQTQAASIMTPKPVTIDAGASVVEAIDKMVGSGFHHLPVIKDNDFIGLIFADDVPEEYRMLLERYKELKG